MDLDRNKEIQYIEKSSFRFRKIISSIPVLPKPIKILDIGTTPFTIFIKKKFQHYDVWTLDRTNLFEDRCKQAGIKFKTCNLDNGSIPFEDEYFDIVIFTEVLEHIFAPPTDILAEIKRILRPKGKLILSVPNIACLLKRIKLLFGITILENADHQMLKDWVHGHGHIHEYTKKEILSLCKSINLEISHVQMLTITPLDVIRQRKYYKPKKVSIIGFLYYCIISLVPQFRPYIYLECYK
jgi:ubiquinone/menaquinone biosynthesis C-methylase UbiE